MGVKSTSIEAQPYFIAIDNEMAAPYVVQWGDRSFSSDSNGRVVLSGLDSGTVDLLVKFVPRTFPDHQFRVPVYSDRQFQLRVLDGRAVGLMDWKDKTIIKNISWWDIAIEKKMDPFAYLMAGVVNDSTLLLSPARGESRDANMPVTTLAAQSPKWLVQDSLSSAERLQVFVDPLAPRKDTVRVRIPLDGISENDSILTTFCIDTATESQLDSLRIQLLEIEVEGDRVQRVKTWVTGKCVLSQQVRNLSDLFFSDEGRLGLFEVTYPRVLDPKAFRELKLLLEEEKSVSRFDQLVQ